jgi:hypothetical protein
MVSPSNRNVLSVGSGRETLSDCSFFRVSALFSLAKESSVFVESFAASEEHDCQAVRRIQQTYIKENEENELK